MEKEFFNIPLDASPENRPIYAYLDGKAPIGENGLPEINNYKVSMYGDTTIILKDKIKERTTIAFADTLDIEPINSNAPQDGIYHPQLIKNADSVCNPINNGAFESDVRNKKISSRISAYAPYCEAQIHGGVKSEDIKKILFSKQPSKKLVKKLKEREIPWEMITWK